MMGETRLTDLSTHSHQPARLASRHSRLSNPDLHRREGVSRGYDGSSENVMEAQRNKILYSSVDARKQIEALCAGVRIASAFWTFPCPHLLKGVSHCLHSQKTDSSNRGMHRSSLLRLVSHQHRLSRYFIVGSTWAVLATAQFSHSSRRTHLEAPPEETAAPPSTAKEAEVPSASTFFNLRQWDGTSGDTDKNSEFWTKIFSGTTTAADEETETSSDSAMPSGGKKDMDLAGLAGNFMNLFSGGKEQQEDAISGIIEKARQSASSSSDLSEEKSFGDLLKALEGYKTMVDQVADKYISSIDFSTFTGTALFYYLEREDEVKNPSWKRRKHRFFRGIDMKYVKELNEFLELSSISYFDTVDLIREGLETHGKPCEIIYAEVNSEPGKPANFVAVPRDQPKDANYLEVVMGVRGTNSLADVITDVICEDVEYRGGAAHKLIVESGKYLVDLHMPMLEELLKNSGKSKIRLLLTGHSLGAGAASIAGIEFNDHKQFDVRVVGFGCPALLSKDLAAEATFVTVSVHLMPQLSIDSI
jgi:hypothetical protein